MSRCLLAAFAVVLAAPVLAAAPVPPEGGKGIVFPYPAKAPVVLCLNGYDKARDRLGKMLTAALPKDAAKLTKALEAELSKLFEGRKLTGLRKDARAFVVVNDIAELFEDTPAVSVLVPVTTYKDFQETFLTKEEQKSIDRGQDGVDALKTSAFGEEMTVYMVDLKEYAAITIAKATADGYAAKYTAGSTETMGTDLAETFLKADVAVYVNMDAINGQYGDQIRAFKGLIDFALQQAQQQGALGVLNKKQIEAVKTMLKTLVQGIEDCHAVVAGAEFRPEGLLLKAQIRFAENTATAKLIATEPPATLMELTKLPAGLGTYQANHFGKTLGGLTRDLAQEFATTEDDARGAELIEQHLKDLAAAGPGADFTALLPPGAAFSLTPYKDAEKAAKAISKAYKAVAAGGRINGIVVKTAPRVGDNAEEYRGFTFSSVNLNHDFEASVAGLPEELREATLDQFKRATPEKAAQWIGTDKKVVVRITAKDWAAAKVLLDRHLDGKATVGASAGFKRVREQLPAEANLLLVAEVESIIANVVSSLKTVGEQLPGFPLLGPLKKLGGGDATYLGLAVTLKDDTATLTAFVPTQAMAAGREVLESLFKKYE